MSRDSLWFHRMTVHCGDVSIRSSLLHRTLWTLCLLTERERKRNIRGIVRWCFTFSWGGESNSDDSFLRACVSVVMLLPDEKPQREFYLTASDVLVGICFGCKVKIFFQCLQNIFNVFICFPLKSTKVFCTKT